MLARFESSRIGQALLSLVIIFVAISIVVINIPESQIRRDAGRYTFPFVRAVGLDQDWGIFSQPRTASAYVDGRIDYADGSSAVISVTTGKWFAAYSDYRWQKYEEIIRPDSGSVYWHDYAEYLLTQASRYGHDAVRVTLIRRFAESLPPGPGPAHGPWQEVTMYVLNVSRSP